MPRDLSFVSLITCSVLEKELRLLAREHWPELRLLVLDSALHLRPRKLGNTLAEVLAGELAGGRQVVLAYGDCFLCTVGLPESENLATIESSNCCAMLLGQSRYHQEIRQGTFFLLPEWCHRWHEIFVSGMQLNQDMAHDIMRDSHSRMLLLDTGTRQFSLAEVEAFSHYCGLPFEIEKIGLDQLQSSVENALSTLPAPLPAT